jgi:hypothetical protein
MGSYAALYSSPKRPGGTSDNSPAIYRRVSGGKRRVPEGRLSDLPLRKEYFEINPKDISRHIRRRLF